MENICKDDDQIELPPGFRFHPTDEELITHYLSPKVLDSCFCARAIGEVDLNKCEPWDLPRRAKMGEKQWYFFCVRDRKYPTGLRTNRATDVGYWKATGKDKEIYKMKTLVGMKKTLVFYKGRAPKGVKTNWVMHEYRLEGKLSVYNLPKSTKNEWVICRVFQKSSGGKKIHISGLLAMSSYGDQAQLHPLTNSSFGETSHVTCFSNPMENNMIETFNTPHIASSSYPSKIYASQIVPEYQDSALIEDQSILRYLLGNQNMKMNPKTEFSQESNDMNSGLSNHEMGQSGFHDLETPCSTSTSVPIYIDCFWNY